MGANLARHDARARDLRAAAQAAALRGLARVPRRALALLAALARRRLVVAAACRQ
ncbi:MAG: hypothetical protein ACM35H_04215 [Bacteroidota bacterium]|nr:hypothetical protein [Kiloniellaceae bacterium]